MRKLPDRNPTRADGMFYCDCGNLVPTRMANCGCAAERNWLDRLRCGICGAPASYASIRGARCYQHEDVVEPSSALIINDEIAVVMMEANAL